MKDKILKIAYFVTAFVLVSAVIFNGFTVPVLASTVVESLPRTDIDVDVVVNSSGFSMQHNGNVYDIPFHYDIRLRNDNDEPYDNWLFWHDRNTLEHVYYSNKYGYCPKYTDMDAYGNILYYSYWFSPSENRIYVFTHMDENSVIQSYSGSTFHFLGESYTYTSVNFWDLNTMEFNRIGMLGMLVSNNAIGGVKPYYKVATNNIISGYADSDFSWNYFPTDMLCVYSNYEISGFYEMDFSSVYAPEYYFKYQYLFYAEGIGYVFIDSASPLFNVEDKKNGYAFINYLDYCNSHVYTSVDGIQWSEHTSVSSMYSNHYQIDYSWFFDNVGGDYVAVLVYSSDKEYGEEPLVKPEYGDINDVVADLNNIIINGGPFPSGRGDGYTFEELESMTELDYYKFIMYGFTHQYYKRITIVYGDGSTDCVYDIESGRYGSVNRGDKTFSYCTIEYVPTLAMYLYDLNLTLDDTNMLLESVKITLHDDLKSVFDNISLSNFYLESIDSTLGSLPDYTKKLDKILFALENLEVTGSGGVVDLSSLEQYLIMIDDTSEIQILLEELDKSIDNIAKIEVFDEITDSTDIVGDVVDNVFDEVFDFEKAPELSKGADEVSGMISGAIGQLATGSILIGAFDYASNITSGVGFINANVNNFYEASSVMKPVFLSGAAMFVVNLVLRRKE